MRFLAMKSVQLVLGLGMFVVIDSIAAAQVVIDMPAPKKAKVRAEAAVVPVPTSVVMAANVASPPTPAPVMVADVGDIALSRYAGARTYPRDTYHYADHYAGIRQYGYPYSIWWGAWGFPGFGCGNKFVGFVGSPHCR